MATKNWNDDFMSQLIDEQAWKELSQDFQWSELLLEKYADKVDWHEVSGNNQMLWTVSMLEKFRSKIDWRELSSSSHQCIFAADMLARFEKYWDWRELSGNSNLELTCELLDRFIDRWDWREIIGRWDDKLFNEEFLERYKEYIPASELQRSRLWNEIVEKRKTQLANQIAAAV